MTVAAAAAVDEPEAAFLWLVVVVGTRCDVVVSWAASKRKGLESNWPCLELEPLL